LIILHNYENWSAPTPFSIQTRGIQSKKLKFCQSELATIWFYFWLFIRIFMNTTQKTFYGEQFPHQSMKAGSILNEVKKILFCCWIIKNILNPLILIILGENGQLHQRIFDSLILVLILPFSIQKNIYFDELSEIIDKILAMKVFIIQRIYRIEIECFNLFFIISARFYGEIGRESFAVKVFPFEEKNNTRVWLNMYILF
jgi:hypothetical protein